MSGLFKFFVGLFGLWLMATAARYVHGDSINADLTTRAESALKEAGLEGVTAAYNNERFGFRRVAVLSGSDNSADTVEKALKTVNPLVGIHHAVWEGEKSPAMPAATATAEPSVNEEEPKTEKTPEPAKEEPAVVEEKAAKEETVVATPEPVLPEPTVEEKKQAEACGDKITTILEGKTVQFTVGRATLKKNPDALLDAVAGVAKDCPDAYLTIAGHTDKQGGAVANQVLSQKRAETVRAYLAAKGVEADHLSAVGYGEDKPLDTADTAAAYAKNRRIEITVSASPAATLDTEPSEQE